MKDITVNKGLTYVSFWKRVGAALLNSLFLLPLIIFYMLTYKYFLSHKMIIPVLAYSFITFSYDVFFNVKFGGTPGKLILKYRIIDKKGEFLSISKALLRNSFSLLSTTPYILLNYVFPRSSYQQLFGTLDIVFTIFIFVDVLFVPFNKNKRALHDYLAGSYVVTKESWSRITKSKGEYKCSQET